MNLSHLSLRRFCRRARERGSILIIVLWIAFGLVSIALYFGHSMIFEYRVAENQIAALQAEQAIEGAARYIRYILANAEEPGRLPEPDTYSWEDVPVGEAAFWLLGRGDSENRNNSTPFFGLADEGAKLNLNTATLEMLIALPGMTPQFAAAIIDWRDADAEISSGGAESETYQRLRPSYRAKDARFETVEELRLISGADLEMLFGEDANRNGILDPNENDGDISLPRDNRDGRLDPGLLEFLTVYSREPNRRADGSNRVNINQNPPTQLTSLLRERFGDQRASQIGQQLQSAPAGGYRSMLQFYIGSRMTPDEFAQIANDLTVSDAPFLEGLINANTAPVEVLAALPGMDRDKAAQMIAYRQANPDQLRSIAWVAQALDEQTALQAAPLLTTRSFQFSADIAAVGRNGRGYRRAWFVFDTSEGDPKIRLRRDFTGLGWALGTQVRQDLLLARQNP